MFIAIRSDRQRGGRSSYDGCSPHGRPKIPGVTPTRKVSLPRTSHHHHHHHHASASLSVVSGTSSGTASTAPRTPQLLEDLMAIESLMNEEEGQQDCCRDKLTPNDSQLFLSLLHFADHCLYKIVRWARNLPDFSGVSVSGLFYLPEQEIKYSHVITKYRLFYMMKQTIQLPCALFWYWVCMYLCFHVICLFVSDG